MRSLLRAILVTCDSFHVRLFPFAILFNCDACHAILVTRDSCRMRFFVTCNFCHMRVLSHAILFQVMARLLKDADIDCCDGNGVWSFDVSHFIYFS